MKPIRCNVDNEGKVGAGRSHIRHAFADFAGKEVAVTITEWQTKRSIDQNSLLHKLIDVYSNEIGYSFLEAKYLLKKEFGLNRLIRNKRTGKQELWVRSTTEYNVDEMTTFLTRLLNHMEHDCGIIIDPEERKQWRIDELTGDLEQIY